MLGIDFQEQRAVIGPIIERLLAVMERRGVQTAIAVDLAVDLTVVLLRNDDPDRQPIGNA